MSPEFVFGKKTVFIETTMLGDSSLKEAMEDGYEEYAENKNKFDSEKKMSRIII